MYQVIARKYRPQTFDEVVGQSHVKQTLRNAIDKGRIAHGYIFSGPRGTGKTTMARILAMALNCEDGPSSTADPQSPVCREIASGSSMDVIEIDAASNRRIDDIRELRESVKFRPVNGRYKVFIIDEAHQITTDAFNALLKTLEEPPEWVAFVLCTTEPQAIPATIASRCQSFAFRSIDLPLVVGHLDKICRSEGVEAESDALTALAVAGDGSMRDSLSALDQAIAAFGTNLEATAVRDLLGAIPSEITDRVLAAIRDADPAAMLAIVDDLFQQGRHPQHFCGELARHFRNLLVLKLAGADSSLVVAGEREREASAQWTSEFSDEDLTRFVQLLLALYQDLQQATQQRFRLELGMLKLVHAGRLRPIEELLSGLPSASSRGSQPAAAAKATPRPAPSSPTPRPPDASPARPARSAETAKGPANDRATRPAAADGGKGMTAAKPEPDAFKRQLLELVRNSEASFMEDAIRSSEVTREGRRVTFRMPDDWMALMELQMSLLEASLVGLVGGKPDVRLVGADPAAKRAGPAKADASERRSPPGGAGAAERRANSDPAFLEFKNRFEGRVSKVMDLGKKGP